MEPVKLDDLQWQSLVNSIRNERCVLFIGPMLASIRAVYFEDDEKQVKLIPEDTPLEQRDWSPVYVQLAFHLTTALSQYHISYDRNYQGDLEYIAQRYLEIDFLEEIDLKETADEFIRQNSREVPGIYHLINDLPIKFPLIVNTASDSFLHQIMGRRNHQFEWYNYEDARNPEIVDFSKNHPLIYNLVGKVGDSKSLVLTEGQQLTFVKKIIQNDPKVPDKIVHKLNPANKIVYLFIGFNFERWQFRMLLDRLNISAESKTIAPQHPWLYQERRTAEFYKSRFNFLFVEDQVEQFLQTLHQKLINQPAIQNDQAANRQANDIPQLYVSYHDNDMEIGDKLLRMLRQLERNEAIRIWHRGMINLGNSRLEQVNNQLRQSRYLMLLISADYMSADEDEIIQTEWQYATTGNWEDDKVVIPVLARSYPPGIPEFINLTVLPRNGKPLDAPSWGSIDQSSLEVYQEFNAQLQQFSTQRNP